MSEDLTFVSLTSNTQISIASSYCESLTGRWNKASMIWLVFPCWAKLSHRPHSWWYQKKRVVSIREKWSECCVETSPRYFLLQHSTRLQGSNTSLSIYSSTCWYTGEDGCTISIDDTYRQLCIIAVLYDSRRVFFFISFPFLFSCDSRV